MKLDIFVDKIDRHRNGVSGEPFYVVLFEDRAYPDLFVATVFDEPGRVAVLSVEKLTDGNIAFGENSWRGDRYESALRAAIEAWEEKRA